ncbi:condensation domain-containing protein, partial [Flavitalea flava]
RIPLSFAQERLWFIDKLEGSVAYHMPLILGLQGQVNEEALVYAFQAVVNRHEVLRTVITEQEGKASQRVLDGAGWRMTMLEDRALKRADRAALSAYLGELIRSPFDLSRDYTLRATLIRVGDQEWMLVLVVHHIASDGWSNAILVKELVNGYRAYREGSSMYLAALPLQYADYAIWQRGQLTGQVWEKKLGYWQDRLRGLEPLNLPTDYVRPATQSGRGGGLFFRLDKLVSESLQGFCRGQGVTVFMTLLATFKVMLYRYSGQEDIAVGSIIAGRQQGEVEDLIGYFTNTLVLRSDLGGNPVFREFLQQVKETTLGAFEHQEVPFEKVVESVVRKRDLSRSALFDVLFVVQNMEEADIAADSLPGLELRRENIAQGTSKFDLAFTLTEGKEGLEGNIEYCTDLYREETISRMVLHYKELLQAVVAAPDLRIGQLPMLPSTERSLLLGYSSGLTESGIKIAEVTGTSHRDKTLAVKKLPGDLLTGHFSLLGFLTRRIEEGGDRIAVVHRGRGLSYGELNRRIEALSDYLRET